MANSDLYGQYFKINSIPLKRLMDDIIKQYGEKAITMKHIVGTENNKEPYTLSYSLAKKIKHFFDNFNPSNSDTEKFEILGGHKMKNYINGILSNKRNSIYKSKSIRKNIAGFDNQFIKTHDKSFLKPTDISKLKIDTNMEKLELMEWQLKETKVNPENIMQPQPMEEIKSASIALIINENKEILLVKRSSLTDWMPEKYALVGGKQDENEDAYMCVLREIFEETNLMVDGLISCYNKKENDFIVNLFFAVCKTPQDLKLSPEHTDYKWVKPLELKDLQNELVPNLIKDIEQILMFIYSKNVINQ